MLDAYRIDFDISTDPFFQERIKPFIDAQMQGLKDLDATRRLWVQTNLPDSYEMTYVFYDHSHRVAEDMRKTAAHMGWDAATCEALYWAMLPHDIGKAALPVHIWDMVDKPEDDIKAERRSHTEKGVGIVADHFGAHDHPFLTLMTDIMLNHHEQMDGKGYRSLGADQLSLPVRLACIIESFDGYSIPRPHFGDRDVSPAGVLRRMEEEKGADLYDMNLFKEFKATKLS